MQLGAYKPSTNGIDSIIWAIESLRDRLNAGFRSGPADDNFMEKKAAHEISLWFRENAEVLVEQWRQDFNLKSPYRGLIPRIKINFGGSNSRYGMSQYTPENSITIYDVDGTSIPKNIKNVFNDPTLGAAMYFAQFYIFLFLHEFIHITQTYPESNVALREPDTGVTLPRLAQEYWGRRGPSYRDSAAEIPTYAVNDVGQFACQLQRKVYRDKNIGELLLASKAYESYLRGTENDNPDKFRIYAWALYNASLIDTLIIVNNYDVKSIKQYDNIEEKVIDLFDKSFEREIDLKNELQYKVIWDLLKSPHAPSRMFVRKPTAKRARVSQSMLQDFFDALKPYVRLRERNLRRWTQSFDPINVHFARQIQANLKNPELWVPRLTET